MKKVRQTTWPYLILVSGPLDPLAKDVLGGEGRLVDVDGPNLKVALLAGGDCVAAVAVVASGSIWEISVRRNMGLYALRLVVTINSRQRLRPFRRCGMIHYPRRRRCPYYLNRFKLVT